MCKYKPTTLEFLRFGNHFLLTIYCNSILNVINIHSHNLNAKKKSSQAYKDQMK